jgi:hypothetical protein
VTLEAGIRVAAPKNLFPLATVLLLPPGDILAFKIPLSSISESAVLKHKCGPGGGMKIKQEHHDGKPKSGQRSDVEASHPTKEDLQRLMAGELPREEVRAVVLHLLRGCPACTRETRRIWSFGEQRPQPAAARSTLPAREVGVWQ